MLKGFGGADTLHGGDGHGTLYGMDGVDTLCGENGNDMLNGGAGDDYMNGGNGSDTFYVDSASDTVADSSGGTFEIVYTSTSYALADGTDIELFKTTEQAGLNSIDLIGNNSSQEIMGNAGGNMIAGGGGNDILEARTLSSSTSRSVRAISTSSTTTAWRRIRFASTVRYSPTCSRQGATGWRPQVQRCSSRR
jgi:Ca2+-binding RTX toxin-like protein